MKILSIRRIYLSILALIFLTSGCGYTTRSLLPSNYRTIKIENFANDIRVAAEQSNMRMYRGYRPGMEIELTRTVINKFLVDGSVKVVKESSADIVLKGALIDFKRDALRYDSNDNVEEYRIKLIVNMELMDTKTGNTVWKENGFAGETTYTTSGALTKSESAAVDAAVDDLARRIMERTVEAW
jgi:outer membrane lipopolysaccharide assembly protein LptE/RlpB